MFNEAAVAVVAAVVAVAAVAAAAAVVAVAAVAVASDIFSRDESTPVLEIPRLAFLDLTCHIAAQRHL